LTRHIHATAGGKPRVFSVNYLQVVDPHEIAPKFQRPVILVGDMQDVLGLVQDSIGGKVSADYFDVASRICIPIRFGERDRGGVVRTTGRLAVNRQIHVCRLQVRLFGRFTSK